MKIEGKHKFNAPLEKVWEALTGPASLEKAIPGCEKLTEQEPGKYDLLLKIGISAVKGTYHGKAEVADSEPPRRYRLIMEGSGTPGFVKGEADIELSEEGERTLVTYHGEGQVGGLIAGVGQRLIGGVAKMLLGQFFKNMEKGLKSQQ
jgi:carbon monoxide dehydrogenase subunit G